MIVNRIRRAAGTVDDYGNLIPGAETTATIPDGWTWPRTSNALTDDGRTGVIVGLTLWCPPGYDLRPDDLVEVNGERFRIDGDAGINAEYESPFTGWNPGSAVALVRVEG